MNSNGYSIRHFLVSHKDVEVNVSILNTDIDKQIEQHQLKIQELEQLKKDHEKKLEGVKEFNDEILRLCGEKSLSESELYASRSEQIEAWLLDMSRQDAPSSIYANLKKHFERVSTRGGKKEKKPAVDKPKLAVGKYRNPETSELVEKIKRNPRQLDEWIRDFGLETVQSWKED